MAARRSAAVRREGRQLRASDSDGLRAEARPLIRRAANSAGAFVAMRRKQKPDQGELTRPQLIPCESAQRLSGDARFHEEGGNCARLRPAGREVLPLSGEARLLMWLPGGRPPWGSWARRRLAPSSALKRAPSGFPRAALRGQRRRSGPAPPPAARTCASARQGGPAGRALRWCRPTGVAGHARRSHTRTPGSGRRSSHVVKYRT